MPQRLGDLLEDSLAQGEAERLGKAAMQRILGLAEGQQIDEDLWMLEPGLHGAP